MKSSFIHPVYCSYTPVQNVVRTENKEFYWKSVGIDPQLEIKNISRLKKGWVYICILINYNNPNVTSKLYVDFGEGVSEKTTYIFSKKEKGKIEAIVNLTATPIYIRFDPMEEEGLFDIQNIRFTQISSFGACVRMIRRINKESSFSDHSLSKIIGKNFTRIKKKGFQGMMVNLSKDYIKSIESTLTDYYSYSQWIKLYGTISLARQDSILKTINNLSYKPKLSILMPVYNTPIKYLRKALDSVLAQLYPHWELCIADDASTQVEVRDVLADYAEMDQRIKIVYCSFNSHISAASNSALELASGDYIALFDHDDELSKDALYHVAIAINDHPEADILYSDEDKIDAKGNRYEPHFKPKWNRELFYSVNYISHLSVIRSSLIRDVRGFRKGFEGSQDYDLLLRCLDQITEDRIFHIPYILYHWRAIEGSTAFDEGEKPYATEVGIKALTEHLIKREPSISVKNGPLPTTYRIENKKKITEKVSLIIPTRNGFQLLRQCVKSIVKKTRYKNYEIIIVDNGSDDGQTLEYLRHLDSTGHARILEYDKPFNYSEINNFAVRHALGQIIGLVNNDIEVISSNWLTEMLSYARRSDIGAVGAKLYYTDGRLQHAGVIVGLGGVAGHSHKGYLGNSPGYFGRLLLPQEMSAVTGACLLVRKSVYDEVGGLNENELSVAFNDVDLCLRIKEKGYRNIWTPYAELYHHESATRGLEDTPEKQARFQREINYMKHRWGSMLLADPAYSPNLTLDREDFSLAFPPRGEKSFSHIVGKSRQSGVAA